MALRGLTWLVLFQLPAVALAVPLYLNLRRIRQLFWPTLTTLVVGGIGRHLVVVWGFRRVGDELDGRFDRRIDAVGCQSVRLRITL